MNHQSKSSNRNSVKTQFTIRFIRALSRIQKTNNPTFSSIKTLKECSHKIKVAADTSMATTIGSSRSWSRAILSKHRNQVRNRVLIRKKVVANNRKTKMVVKRKKKTIQNKEGHKAWSRTDKLRQLVPGGEAMDLCSLLEETAHYIKCLNMKVQVMQEIADKYTT